MNGRVLGRSGNRDADMAPQGAYPTADDSWVALSIRDDPEWQRLVEVLGSPAWAADPVLIDGAVRTERHDEIDAALAEWTLAHSASEVVERLRRAGIPAAETLVATRMYGEPQLEARGYYQALDHPRSGERRYPTWPIKFSYGPEPAFASVAPTLGQHNREILQEELGLSDQDLARLEKTGIIGDKMAR